MILKELLCDSILEYEIIKGCDETIVSCIHNDSRLVKESDLFFCIVGAKSDGHSFIKSVIEKGASVIVVSKDINVVENVTVVKVKDTRYAMGIISSKFYGEPSKQLNVIGITGTKGKTTTTYMIKEMLELSGYKTGLIGTIEVIDGKNTIPANNTTPESLLLHKTLKDMLDNGCDSVVMEVSSQGLMLDRVAGVEFDYGIFTNLTKDHIGPNEHKTFEEYMMWKAKLFSLCKKGIFNIDDVYKDEMIKDAKCEIITYGKGIDAKYRATFPELYVSDGVLGIKYELNIIEDKQGVKEDNISFHEILVDLPGDFSVHNSLAAIAVARELDVSMEKIKKILADIKVRGRVEMIPISEAFTLMIDYAHNAMSLESILNTIKQYDPKRLITVFGCGGDRSRDRRFEMGEISGKIADISIITSDNPRTENPKEIINDILTGIKKTSGEFIEIIDRKEAIRYAIMNAKSGDVIVLAGKGHEDYQEINGIKYHMDERELIREILEEEDATKICGYNNRYFA